MARFDVFTAMKIKIVVFHIVAPCSDVVGYQRFGGSRCLHLQDEVESRVTHRNDNIPPHQYTAPQPGKPRTENFN